MFARLCTTIVTRIVRVFFSSFFRLIVLALFKEDCHRALVFSRRRVRRVQRNYPGDELTWKRGDAGD